MTSHDVLQSIATRRHITAIRHLYRINDLSNVLFHYERLAIFFKMNSIVHVSKSRLNKRLFYNERKKETLSDKSVNIWQSYS